MLAIKLDIIVNDLPEMLALYNRIEVHRSITSISGIYSELTNIAGPLPAEIDGTENTWGTLSNLTLQFFLDGSEESITITLPATNPSSLQTIINAINSVVPRMASEVPTDTNRLRLTSPSEGTGASLEIVPGDVATALGLSSVKVNGTERRIRLMSPTTMYSFFDKDGDNSFWYKTRFSNTANSSVSDFSDARQGGLSILIPPQQIVKGTLDLIDGIGRPVIGRRIIFIPNKITSIPSTSAWVVPGFDARIEVLTNEAGHASANLLCNVSYRVIIEGTSFIREFTTPTDNTDFDILSIASTVPDSFDIVATPPRPIKVTI